MKEKQKLQFENQKKEEEALRSKIKRTSFKR